MLREVILIALMAYFFTGAVYTSAKGAATDVRNASVAVTDRDRSELTSSIVQAIRTPYFKSPEMIDEHDEKRLLDLARYVFILDFPPDFEKDLLSGRQPVIGLTVDATALTHAGTGTGYLSQIIQQEISGYLARSGRPKDAGYPPVRPVYRSLFNLNSSSIWHMGVTQIIGNLSLLTLILAGAAVIRERERGTMEHLLVMPVTSGEIAFSKIVANVLVILMFTLASLLVVVRLLLGVEFGGSVGLFALGSACYIFSFAALGIMLATVAPSMPQFGLLCIPVYLVMYLLSGAMTPLDNMAPAFQEVMMFSPTARYTLFTHQVIFRNAGLDTVGGDLIYIIASGAVFMAVVLMRFRQMLSRQG